MIGAGALATVPAILAAVNLAKRFGVRGKWSALLAVLFGIAAAVLDYTFGTDFVVVTAHGVYAAAVTGFFLGMAAAGLYDVTSTIGGWATPPKTDAAGDTIADPDTADAPRWSWLNNSRGGTRA